ncbi:rhodanese-like domain-containing protein [Streptomyces poriferorum]|uniref:Rhodanese-like domain-containing protein n=1 Tax=Streptomyces poriferorum TaxID=2798799 RepID=A0ABY9IUT8_9ACTN|nr:MULTISPECIES: rhodanese-like domain-containing protein [unclassified Streptomyces]WSQ45201.1 rhodanese-like domain-containing protein [Streptomyces sp. NBC_01220]MDP5313218.1 rhodanese-like domain-containing protein [Streptomyces sp. Alt4]WLQ49524.1 rhodanese-like domain-containing protein [Streptomyces sp. Alt1]WLQ57793.1 rhodanese-like domain-containing protein [Streptomyces sp. Alt2]WSI64342.1 rhodanese-like domain-containing protein [Streptomyces sp. NBC_01336]
MNFAPLPAVAVTAVPADGFVLDVREDDEWAAGHVDGALHIPMSDFVGRFGELTEAAEDGRRVHVMCRVGGRSAQVTQYLVQQGIDAVNIDGGMLAWDGAGRPMVTDNGAPAFVA